MLVGKTLLNALPLLARFSFLDIYGIGSWSLSKHANVIQAQGAVSLCCLSSHRGAQPDHSIRASKILELSGVVVFWLYSRIDAQAGNSRILFHSNIEVFSRVLDIVLVAHVFSGLAEAKDVLSLVNSF